MADPAGLNVAKRARDVVWQQGRGLEPKLIQIGRGQKTQPDVVELYERERKIAGGQGGDAKRACSRRRKPLVVQQTRQVIAPT